MRPSCPVVGSTNFSVAGEIVDHEANDGRTSHRGKSQPQGFIPFICYPRDLFDE